MLYNNYSYYFKDANIMINLNIPKIEKQKQNVFFNVSTKINIL